jgi:valyl-tRNA synthetase
MSEENTIPKKFKPADYEGKWQQFWEEEKVYKWDPTRSREETFVVDTPPPTVSGALHIGHIFSYTQTDIQVRYNRMQGKNIFYPLGWDDNGLPSERRVQNVYGIQCNLDVPYDDNWTPVEATKKKKEADQVSRKNFIEACSILTKKDEEAFKNLYTRLGLSVDWDLEYDTIGKHSQTVSQLSFLDLVEKEQVYLSESPTMWDVDFQTAIAQAELEDKEDIGFFYDLKFKIKDTDDHLVIATTRPELLGACVAVVVHPEDDRYKEYVGKTALTPLYGANIPIMTSEHAEIDKGTGVLMICTFGDASDVEWWKHSKMPIKQIIDKSGRIMPIDFTSELFVSEDTQKADKAHTQIVGKKVKPAKKIIAELLKESGDLLDDPKQTKRFVKYYEKGESPVEYISTRQWFIKILEHKEELVAQGEKINWHPEHMKTRYMHWVQGLNQDWCISRQRFFGVPFPVWFPIDEHGYPNYQRPLFAKKDKLPVDPMVDCPEGYTEEQRNQPNGFMGEKDVMDTWATSSVSPQIATHWGIDQDRHDKLFPMDLRPQSHEIIRTWAFYTVTKAWLHEKKVPWTNIAISGWILDPDRKKMSKSKGNVVTPESYFDTFSADAVRYWTSRARLGVDTAFDENVFKIGKKLSNKLFNASKFVLMQLEGTEQAQLDDVNNITMPIDKSWYSMVLKQVEAATKYYDNFDYATATQTSESLFWTFCDHYLELVKGRSYSEENSPEKLSSLATLNLSLKTFLKLLAPVLPHLCEEIWSWRFSNDQERSIHKNSWPKINDNEMPIYKDFTDAEFETARKILTEIRSAKSEAQKKMKWPVEKLVITGTDAEQKLAQSVIVDVNKAGNVTGEVTYSNGEELATSVELSEKDCE